MYSKILEDVKYIELYNGMTRMYIKVEDRDAIECIVDEISDVICLMRSDQNDKAGWRHSIRCYAAKSDAWFELTYGVSSLHDNLSDDNQSADIFRFEFTLLIQIL
ncbi:MAG: hypothetical protein CVU95_16205 [Firmicutes bacterium HGW-Firmicutes-2]|nr:MAG: hypothetical protein CVU95_16205 [Firmicutes bacterium HGW-Firmicutes-2]